MTLSAIRADMISPEHERVPFSPVELHNALLKTIAGALDIRDAFPGIARVANRMLPYDCLTVAVHDPIGNLLGSECSAQDFPAYERAFVAGRADVSLVDNLHVAGTLEEGEPRVFGAALAAVGYQSSLSVRAEVRERVVSLGFFSKRLDRYAASDVDAARLIADSIAVIVAHRHLADAERVAYERHLRTEPSTSHTRTLGAGTQGQIDMSGTIGQSAEWRQVLKKAARVALTETTVFIQGESGTGKEVVARFIHRASPRRNGPFVAINCAALPEQLLESELFGYERGAFTGAQHSKIGQIELASGGVLLLDEVSEMPPSSQAKLLRFLQEREFQRLGGIRPIKANVRVIAASNRDLHAAMREGAFREDLYYRLQVFEIRIPPLRERRSDILPLADAFLGELNGCAGHSSTGLGPDAQALLMRYGWPGNVRQLHNALERASILCEGGQIAPEHFLLHIDSGSSPRRDLPEVERRTIEDALHETDWNKSRAARRLGITRAELYGRLRKYGLDEK